MLLKEQCSTRKLPLKLQEIQYVPLRQQNKDDVSIGKSVDELINECTLIGDKDFEDSIMDTRRSSTPIPSSWESVSIRSLIQEKVEDASFNSLIRRSSRIGNSFRDLSPPRSTTPNQSRALVHININFNND